MTVREVLNKILDMDVDEILGLTNEPADAAVEDEVTEIEETVPEKKDYSKIPIVDLYKECRNRGISVRKQQSAEVYIKALEKYDMEAAEADEDDEDWGEEEEETATSKKKATAPAKTSKTKPKATATRKNAKKSSEPEDEDDEDWEC